MKYRIKIRSLSFIIPLTQKMFELHLLRIRDVIILLSVLFNLNAIGQTTNSLSDADKIYGLSKFWSEATYNFPYFNYLQDINTDSLLKEFIPKVVETRNDYEYYLVLGRFAALYRDNHTYVYFPDYMMGTSILRSNFTKYRIGLSLIEGKAIVVQTGESSKSDIPLGSEILEVDGVPVNTYLTEVIMPGISSSGENRLLRVGVKNLLMGWIGTESAVKIKMPSGEIREIELIRGANKDPWYPKKNGRFYQSMENISYLKVESFANTAILDSLQAYLNEIRSSKGIIIDIRGNTGGSSVIAKDLAQYFINDSVITGSAVKTRLNLGVYRNKGAHISPADTIGDEMSAYQFLCYNNLLLTNLGVSSFNNSIQLKERIIQPIIVLIDADNISAAEEFLMYLHNQDHIVFMGESTGGGNGQPMIFTLPGGGTAGVCTQYCSYPNGSDYYRNGFEPDIKAHQTLSDFINGIDTVKEMAKAYLNDLVKSQR